jgi:predicted O-methyltransferase YrrM
MEHLTTLDDSAISGIPIALRAIESDSHALGFSMESEPRTGSFLRALAASKPGGRILELGTGTGLSTTWILDGMDATASLTTVEMETRYIEVARRHLGHDKRVTFKVASGEALLRELHGASFDLIFADTWPGKFDHLEDALSLLAPGGMYVIDDLLPQSNWPAGHATKVPALVSELERDPRLITCKLSWSSGLLLATRRL